MYPYLISFAIHIALLGFVMLWPHPATPKHYATMPIELTMVSLPMGDHGQHDRPSPKSAPSFRKSSVAQPPAPTKAIVEQSAQPRVTKPTKGTSLDLDAALKKRFSNSSDTDRAEQLAQAQEGSGNGGPSGVGLVGTGNGMNGELASRGLRSRIEPVFPEGPLRMGLEGHVDVKIWVDAEGNIADVQIIRSSGREFDNEALRAIRQWKFSPQANAPLQTGIVPVDFQIQK